MKKLIAAALLVATPMTAHAAADSETITEEELNLRAKVCLRIALNQATLQQAWDGLQLDTPEKKRQFAIQCKMFLYGADMLGEGSHT